MSLSRGYLSDGKPRLYAIEALKLYFFYSTANRDAFLLSKSEALSTGERELAESFQGLAGCTARRRRPAAEPGDGRPTAAPVAPHSADD